MTQKKGKPFGLPLLQDAGVITPPFVFSLHKALSLSLPQGTDMPRA